MKDTRKNLKMDESIHYKLKVAAAKAGMTMQDFVEYLINKHNEEKDNEQRD